MSGKVIANNAPKSIRELDLDGSRWTADKEWDDA